MEVRFYVDDRGRNPTERFLNRLGAMEKRRINQALARMIDGNLGDHKALGGGLFERRFDFGPGYRVYFARFGEQIILLLGAGDKPRQEQDIERARERLADYDRRTNTS